MGVYTSPEVINVRAHSVTQSLGEPASPLELRLLIAFSRHPPPQKLTGPHRLIDDENDKGVVFSKSPSQSL